MPRPIRRRAGLLLAGLVLLNSAALRADPHSRSWSQWSVHGDQLLAHYTLPLREARRLPGPGSAATRLLTALPQQLQLRADGQRCTLLSARPQAAPATLLRVELRWQCPATTGWQIEHRLLQRAAPGHIHFARFLLPQQPPLERLFTRRHSSHSLTRTPTDTPATAGSGLQVVGIYTELGIEHILIGFDHLAFLLGLLLLGGRRRDLFWLVSAFTLGHSITLALTTLGQLQPNGLLVEGLIAYSIAIVAAGNVAANNSGRAPDPTIALALTLGCLLLGGSQLLWQRGPGLLTLAGLALFGACYLALSQRRLPLLKPLLALLFGLVHGCGFAAVLLEAGLPAQHSIAALFGFNLGVELGQLTLLAALLLAARLLLPAARREALPGVLLNSALCGLGVFWLLQRWYF